MKKPIVVGITGGIGSGKSTVVNVFKQLNVPVYIADIKAKYLMQNNTKLVSHIKEKFGDQSYNKNGTLNNAYLSNIVFNDSQQLKSLNDIVHPVVRKDFKAWLEKQTSDYVLYESALIFEHQQQERFDCIILVTAPKEERIKRVKKRDSCSTDDVKKRMSKQLDDEIKKKEADLIIENIEISQIKEKVNRINAKILKNIHKKY